MPNPTPSSDATVGDSNEEFVRLLIANQSRIYAYIVSLLPNWADADEICQETFIVLWSKRDEFCPGTNFLAWSCRIAMNKVFNHRKRQARSQLVFDDDFLKSVSDHRMSMPERIESQIAALKGCIERLGPRDRELLEQWYQRRGTTKGMAERIGRPIGAIYKAVQRIRRKLFDCVMRRLREEGVA